LNKYIAGGVEDEEVARTNWDFARQYEVWPYNADVLNEQTIGDMLKVSVDTGIIDPATGELSFEDVVATDILERAQQYVGGDVTLEDIEAGNIPEPDCC
jgi:hypothetical protein